VRFRRWLSTVYWRFSRWTPEVAPIPDRGVVIGVPHTSNWDFVLMLFVGWYGGIDFRFLAKSSLFRGPFDTMFRALGGIPVYRGEERGLVREIVSMVERGEKFHLVITPEATRGRVEYWKSGFYRIAQEADLPVVLGFIDRRRMACGIGGSMTLTGDVRADMDRIRAHYDGFVGVRPGYESVPRLRDEPTD
jgi:1-acyl-sn-glycerol-3-phosphate acyltransferase